VSAATAANAPATVIADDDATLHALGICREPGDGATTPIPTSLVAAWQRLEGCTRPVVTTAPSWRSAAPVMVVAHASRSQFDVLTELAARDAAATDVVAIALAGERFRGQRGRAWSALAGNLHLCRSAVLELDAASTQGALAAVPAVAAANAIEAVLSQERVAIKWVNDLVLHGHKVGGVITATHLRAQRVATVVWGIGINVAHAPTLERDPRAPRVSALSAYGATAASLGHLAAELIRELDVGVAQLRAGDGAAIVDAYRARSNVIGRVVEVWPSALGAAQEAPLARGRVLALRDDLGLELEGVERAVYTGRLTLSEDG